MIFIDITGIEEMLSRNPQLYSRKGLIHEFDNLSKTRRIVIIRSSIHIKYTKISCEEIYDDRFPHSNFL